MMPFHTSLASGLMLGGAWAIASISPRIAEITVQTIDLSTAFLLVAGFQVLSGLSAIGIRGSSIGVVPKPTT
jgi:hypothetical protein